MNGNDLLTDFRRHRSESAFAELVRRYTNLIYSVAKRRLSDDALAQEATQTVFIRLAQAVGEKGMSEEAGLVGWLHRTAVHVSIDLWRSESRRRVREQQAAAMRTEIPESPSWEALAPLLDEALNDLAPADRQTLLLRFFDGQSMRELGTHLGVSEDAAKMRVSRALDRLREHLKGHGVACGAVALGTLLADRAVEAAPATVVATLASMSFPIAVEVGAGAGTIGTATGFGARLSGFLQAQRFLVLGVAGLAMVAIVALRTPRSADRGSVMPSNATAAMPAALASLGTDATSGPRAVEPVSATTAERPDPVALLQGVIRARRGIDSGSMNLELTSERRFNVHQESAVRRLSCRFDGSNLWWEQNEKDYRYTAVGPDSEAQQARIEKEQLDRATALREGLIQDFDSRHVTAYDGASLMTYWEIDGKPSSVTIEDPKKGSSQFVFDPRCLGLATVLSLGSTVEGCLGYEGARSIDLVGRESVDGHAAWHVRVVSRWDSTLDFWIDVAAPARVWKCANGRDVVRSKYDPAIAGAVLPSEVVFTKQGPEPGPLGQRWVLSNVRLNHPVEPATFTLTGLGIPAGTEIVDVRNHRIIGKWNGATLTDRDDRSEAPSAGPGAPTLESMRSTLELDPTSSSGLEAALWVLLHTPDGPDVEKAADVIAREHARNAGLGPLCRELEQRLRPRCATNLLQAILRENPDPVIQATACFSLATLFKEAAAFGRNTNATTEAVRLFDRVVREFRSAGPVGADLARKAEPELHELRHLTLGQKVPVTQGLDLEGNPLDLASYRDQVVVLVFWSASTSASDVEEFYRLQERHADKPFAILGVYCDDDLKRARQAVEKRIIRWPSFHDTRSGPIAKAWNVHSWPTRVVIDRQGRLQYRSDYERNIEAAVEKLLEGSPAGRR